MTHKSTHLEKKATSPYNTEQYKEGLQDAHMHVPVCMYIAKLSIIIGNVASKLIQIRYSAAISDEDKKGNSLTFVADFKSLF